MTFDLFNAEFVESYLNNELSPEDKLRFEQELATNNEFSDFVKLYNEVDNAVVEQDVMDLRQNLNSIHEIATEEWIEDTPMLMTKSFVEDIEEAIGEFDVMDLRSNLNEIHDLHQEELHSSSEVSELESLGIDSGISLSEAVIAASEEELIDSEIFQAIMQDDVMELRNNLDSIGEEIKEKPVRKTVFQRMPRFAAIASIALLVLLGATSWFAINSQPMKPEKAVERFFEPIPPKSNTRGGADDQKLILKNTAYDSYSKGDYMAALVGFSELRLLDGSFVRDGETAAYVGSCYFATGQYDKALKEFKIIYESNGAWIEKAEWYISLCYLRDKELKPEAIEMLQQIAITHDHEYQENSIKLLKKLKT